MKYHCNFREWYHSRTNPIRSYVMLSRFNLHPRKGLHIKGLQLIGSRLECGHPWTGHRSDWVRTIQWHAPKIYDLKLPFWLVSPIQACELKSVFDIRDWYCPLVYLTVLNFIHTQTTSKLKYDEKSLDSKSWYPYPSCNRGTLNNWLCWQLSSNGFTDPTVSLLRVLPYL